MMTNMLIVRNRLAALIQRIKSLQSSKINLKNKPQNDRNLSFKLCSKLTKQRSRRDNTMSNRSNQTNNSINKNRNDKIVKFFLKKTDEQSSNFKDERICYNCDEKEYISSKCLKFKQKKSQINVIENSRQNIQIDVEKTLLIRFIIDGFNKFKI